MVTAVAAVQRVTLAVAVLAIGSEMGAINAFAVDVTSHEAQAWDAVLSHLDVITCLDRALARCVEVRVLDGVGQENRVAATVVLTYTDVVERSVAVNLLVRQGNGVGLQERVGGCERVGGVADIASQALAGIGGAIQVEVEVQGLVRSQAQSVVNVGIVLIPDVLELGAIERSGQVWGDRVLAANVVDALGCNTGVGCEQVTVVASLVLAAAGP